MKIGIMQPYFMPYIGYFQLIDAVDVYVNLDHVNFMKRSYMTRNTLKNGVSISIPIREASQNKKCNESFISTDLNYFEKLSKTLEHLYSSESRFQSIYQLLFEDSSVWTKGLTISELNLHFIKKICSYLGINTEIVETSEGLTDQKRNKGIQEIVSKFHGSEYINAIGGQELYTKEDFKSVNIDLWFIKMESLEFDNPYASILDLLFRYDKDLIQSQLKKYILI